MYWCARIPQLPAYVGQGQWRKAGGTQELGRGADAQLASASPTLLLYHPFMLSWEADCDPRA